jgi:hypothetical protein
MAINFNNVTLELDGVQTILVSDIQPDPNSDYYVRLLTFFTDPPDTPNRAPIITIKLFGGSQSGNEKTELEIMTPSLEF